MLQGSRVSWFAKSYSKVFSPFILFRDLSYLRYSCDSSTYSPFLIPLIISIRCFCLSSICSRTKGIKMRQKDVMRIVDIKARDVFYGLRFKQSEQKGLYLCLKSDGIPVPLRSSGFIKYILERTLYYRYSSTIV